ncbi:hypothetical protein [Bacteriovorax sp. Seq25_V]|uniref:hypothetical protein n=1 Tax=Bacteriovorax sp. Seq25_V TaxID=1201288 RepID=UPI00038A23D9|nr:hypothetical protein [Bacteriovorax sp. Seq25_V]EQC43784.1 hypothetical protein M900_1264 [Bacteriovorax sp. Seq25_V]
MRKFVFLIPTCLLLIVISINTIVYAGTRSETKSREKYRNAHIVRSNEEYQYKACQKYNNEDNEDYFIKCVDGEILEEEDLNQLGKNLYEINIKLYKSNVLKEIKEASLATLNEQEKATQLIINCLKNLSSHAKCSQITEDLLSNTKSNLIKMRQELALATGKEKIEHLVGDTNIPTLTSQERKVFNEAKEFLNFRSEQEWMQKGASRIKCIEQDASGTYYIKESEKTLRGHSCSNHMKNQLNNHVKSENKKLKEKFEDQYLKRLDRMPLLSQLNLSGEERDEVISKELQTALKESLAQVQSAKQKLNSLRSNNLYEVFSNSLIVENYLERMGPPKFLCDVAQGYRDDLAFDEIKTDMALIGTALIGGGICGLTAGLGCAIGIGLTMEAANLAISANRVSSEETNFLAGLNSSQSLLDREEDFTLNLVLAPLAIGGEFVGKGIKYGAKGLKQSRHDIDDSSIAIVDNYQKAKLKKVSQYNVPKLKTAKQLEHEYAHFILTSPRLNQRWIDTAKDGDAAFFLDVENSALKRLNDTYGNKEAVTSLTNLHKDIMMQKMKRLLANYPDVDFEVYSDFKSLRFAFLPKEMPLELRTKLETELGKVYKESNEEFASQINAIGLFDNKEQPQNWFSGAIADTADQAGLASKKSRSFLRSDSIRDSELVKYSDLRLMLTEQVDNLKKFQFQLSSNKKFKDSPYFVTLDKNQKTISPELIDTLRKYDPQINDIEMMKLTQTIKKEYGLNLTTGETRDFLSYIQELNGLTPGLWVPKREIAHLDNATLGGFTGDVTGMGSQNIFQIAKDVASSKAQNMNLEDTIKAIRNGEREVTENFNSIKKNFELTVREDLQRKGISHDVICSGDDCAVTIKETLTKDDQRDIIKSFSKQDNPSQYRMSFIPDNTPKELRLKIAAHGEMVEKRLRKSLRGLSDGDIPPEMLKEITLATSMPAKLGDAPIDLLIGFKNPEKLTEKQRSNIAQKLKDSIFQLNQDILINEKGYRVGSVIIN